MPKKVWQVCGRKDVSRGRVSGVRAAPGTRARVGSRCRRCGTAPSESPCAACLRARRPAGPCRASPLGTPCRHQSSSSTAAPSPSPPSTQTPRSGAVGRGAPEPRAAPLAPACDGSWRRMWPSPGRPSWSGGILGRRRRWSPSTRGAFGAAHRRRTKSFSVSLEGIPE
jgi:hypothetical protein